MHISKFRIQGFKSFDDVTLHLNEDLNVFTGVNNSGKTTVLEALSLWQELFVYLIVNKINSSAVQLGYNRTSFIQPSEIISVRKPNFKSIFIRTEVPEPTIILTATIQLDSAISVKESDIWKSYTNISIGIKMKLMPAQNYAVEVIYKDKNHAYIFSKAIEHKKDISSIFVAPVAFIPENEDLVILPKIRDKVIKRKSLDVIRNRILRLNELDFERFRQSLTTILNGRDTETTRIDFRMTGDPRTDLAADVLICLKPGTDFVDLAMVGSGTLQIIEILLAFTTAEGRLFMLFLDEPDAHIHRSLQQRLLDHLQNNTAQRSSTRTQIFVTTHNDGLIKNIPPSRIFHFETNKNTNQHYYPIFRDGIVPNKQGLQPTNTANVLNSLGYGRSADFIQAIESEVFFLVEGGDDANYIRTILNANDATHYANYAFWSFDGVGNMWIKIEAFRDIFSAIRNEKSLWDKAILVFDRDFLRNQERRNLIKVFKEKFGIRVYIWEAYTFEATILMEQNKLIRLLKLYAEKYYRKDILFSDLETALQNNINLVIQEKLSIINSVEKRDFNTIKDQYKGLMQKLVDKNLNKLLDGSRVLEKGDAADLANAYMQEISSDLQSGKLFSFAKKEDVHFIIKNTLLTFDIDLGTDLEVYFPRLLNTALYGLEFDEWNAIDKLMQNRPLNL